MEIEISEKVQEELILSVLSLFEGLSEETITAIMKEVWRRRGDQRKQKEGDEGDKWAPASPS